jgi:predicted MFS family arabinose efflux permease
MGRGAPLSVPGIPGRADTIPYSGCARYLPSLIANRYEIRSDHEKGNSLAVPEKTNFLFSREFITLNAVTFLTYCNIAVFFQFHEYLGTLPIARDRFGLLISLFALSAVIVRPLVSPFLNPSNSARWIGISSVLVIISLWLYPLAHDFFTMACIRLFHGAVHTILAVAVLSLMVGFIPRERSGQAFGLIFVVVLLPYAVVPPILEPLNRELGGFGHVLEFSAACMALVFPLLWLGNRKNPNTASPVPETISIRETLHNLKDFRILIVFVIAVLVWTAFTPVFFFLKGFGEKLGIDNPGWFFTLSTLTEILVRVTAGSFFDKFNKAKLLVGSLIWTGLGYVFLSQISGPWGLYALGLALGIGWGIAMPLLSSLTFDYSRPRFRAVNSNLTMQMFQLGFFLGPALGDAILVHWGYETLYLMCAGVMVVGTVAGFALIWLPKQAVSANR